MNSCPVCSISGDRIWISSEYAIVYPADEPAADGHVVVAPKEHVSTIHAVPLKAQRAVWALVSEVRRRLRTGLVPGAGFRIGVADGLTTPEGVAHTVIHIIPRRRAETGTLPECSDWISDDGLLP